MLYEIKEAGIVACIIWVITPKLNSYIAFHDKHYDSCRFSFLADLRRSSQITASLNLIKVSLSKLGEFNEKEK